MKRQLLRWLPQFLLALLLGLAFAAGPVAAKSKQQRLQATLYEYAGTFRWGEVEQIVAYFDTGEKAAKPPTAFDIQRWKQWRVVGYRAQPYAMFKDGFAEQVVTIEISNVNTLATKTIVDRQRWRYDDKRKHWMLMTGLPVLTNDSR